MSTDWSQFNVASLREKCRAYDISPVPKKKAELLKVLQKYEEENENKDTSNKQEKDNTFKSPKPVKKGTKRPATKGNKENNNDDDDDEENEFQEPAAKRRKISKNTKSISKSKSASKSKSKSKSNSNTNSPKSKTTTTTKSKIEIKDNEDDNDNDIDDEAEDDDSKVSESVSNRSNNGNSKDIIKIVCFNINGVRAATKNGLEDYLNSENADIFCFSEMKADKSQNTCKFGKDYQIIWNNCTEKKGYAGSCIITKIKPLSITKGIGCEDAQGRAIILEFNKFYLINTYVPNSGQKLKFEDRRKSWDIKMKNYLSNLQKKKSIIWTGDLNVAIEDWDVYDGITNKNRCKSPGFTPYERKNFRNILNELSLIDSWRNLYPNSKEDGYTFYTARSRGKDMKKEGLGWRLDYFVVSKNIMPLIEDIKIKKDIGCSDHVPLVLTIKNPDTNL